MFTFHHVNAFQVPASSSSNGRQHLVLDTVGWGEINFENSQHNLTTAYYKGEQEGVCWVSAANKQHTLYFALEAHHSLWQLLK